MENIIWAVVWFVIMGGIFGGLLAFASKVFAVKVDERVAAVKEQLPGANCGGCGYAGCSAYAEAIVKGEAKPNLCSASGADVVKAISKIVGVEVEAPVRMRAQVMCSGTIELARKKYVYEGAHDCNAAVKLGGGDKVCPNGCIGLGTCAAACPFEAINIVNGLAAVDYLKCKGCGVCVSACPKHIIKLIPFNSAHWVGCMSVDNGAVTRSYCDVGCISCRLCQKNCEAGAITVNDFVASIDYSKCVGCGKCIEKCPRKIIWSGEVQKHRATISSEDLIEQ